MHAVSYDALATAGGRAPEYLRLDADVIALVRHFAEKDKPIVAICHAAQLLAAADVIWANTNGKRINEKRLAMATNAFVAVRLCKARRQRQRGCPPPNDAVRPASATIATTSSAGSSGLARCV